MTEKLCAVCKQYESCSMHSVGDLRHHRFIPALTPTREVHFFLSVDDKCYTEHEVIDLVRYAVKALSGCPRCLAKPGEVHLRDCKV